MEFRHVFVLNALCRKQSIEDSHGHTLCMVGIQILSQSLGPTADALTMATLHVALGF